MNVQVIFNHEDTCILNCCYDSYQSMLVIKMFQGTINVLQIAPDVAVFLTIAVTNMMMQAVVTQLSTQRFASLLVVVIAKVIFEVNYFIYTSH